MLLYWLEDALKGSNTISKINTILAILILILAIILLSIILITYLTSPLT
ncbi:hypothetical protein [Methanonatronarchaeum sp. AMET-Sl]|nr:hypothetical protein [Methanonatronarchaeum sp. AMET-Sl]WGI16729.1 hypothetical protein QEN48_04345 [Methanonatronarchaeum sp. AMET-Sl]